MTIEVKEEFFLKKSKQEILLIFRELVVSRKGKIVASSQDTLVADFGSKIMIRLLGAVLIATFFKNQLPFRLEVKIEPKEKGCYVKLLLSDNMGMFIIRDSMGKESFSNFFLEFISEIKKAGSG